LTFYYFGSILHCYDEKLKVTKFIKNSKGESVMKKLVQIGDSEVVSFIKETFAKASLVFQNYYDIGYFSCPAGCGFICPGIKEEFEVTESIEFPNDKTLGPGIYRIAYHDGGNTSHYIQIEKYDNGGWENHLKSCAGWDGDVMVNWISIKRITVQSELQF
jgi:hypothetical protein